MGVRGFTTYMSHHSHLFLKSFQLKNCYLVLDGSGIAIHLYQWHTRANYCFGGDYDNYANTVYNFFNFLSKCNVTPIILFDGGYENRKLKTVYSRMRNRVGAIKRLNPITQSSVCVYPLFIKELFQDIAMEMGVKCIRNDYESDSEIACLARNLNCPILGYDSDFYFFDTLYIPFSTFEMKIFNNHNKETNKNEPYIPCKVYQVDDFLDYFGGMNKEVLPLLAVLLGNDYVKKSFFGAFHRHMKLKKSKAQNEQQKIIKSVIKWLSKETLETAISKILGRFKARRRRTIMVKLNGAMKGYLQVNCSLIAYLGDAEQRLISTEKEKEFDISTIKPSEEEDVVESSEELSSSSDTEEIDKNEENTDSQCEKIDNTSGKNTCFVEKYRKCELPQCFVDIKFRHTYFCLSQIEDYSEPQSHFISFKILNCIHKILIQPSTNNLMCIARTGDKGVQRIEQSYCNVNLPSFEEIQTLNVEERKRIFFDILGIGGNFQEFLAFFPKKWCLFLIALKYWNIESRDKIDNSYVYSLVICVVILNVVDPQVGFCRSSKTLQKKLGQYQTGTVKSIENSLFENINLDECLKCLEVFLDYFHMDDNVSSKAKLFDVSVPSNFSQFQSCVFHIKYLNSIFNFPFENVLVSKFFTGTLLYNLTVNFRKRNNLNIYISNLLKDCPNILAIFQSIIKRLEQNFGKFSASNAKKTRRRKRKTKVEENVEIMEVYEDEELFVDEENKYSILQNVAC